MNHNQKEQIKQEVQFIVYNSQLEEAINRIKRKLRNKSMKESKDLYMKKCQDQNYCIIKVY